MGIAGVLMRNRGGQSQGNSRISNNMIGKGSNPRASTRKESYRSSRRLGNGTPRCISEGKRVSLKIE